MASFIRKVPYFNGRKNVERGVIKCACGREVTCRVFTNTCDCGRDYNMSGSLLADRSQWGAETGEHATDVVRITGEESDW